jgi:hypothetical protein
MQSHPEYPLDPSPTAEPVDGEPSNSGTLNIRRQIDGMNGAYHYLLQQAATGDLLSLSIPKDTAAYDPFAQANRAIRRGRKFGRRK